MESTIHSQLSLVRIYLEHTLALLDSAPNIPDSKRAEMFRTAISTTVEWLRASNESNWSAEQADKETT